MPVDALQHAAQLHRRWCGAGALLFVIFYSFFFSAQLKLEKADLYLVDSELLSANTASFFNDLVAPRAQAGSNGAGKGSAFMLLHHLPARVLVAALAPFSGGGERLARRHSVGTLTACAGASTVVLLYVALLRCGVGRLRALLLAGILGASASVLLMAVLPQPQIFSALGLTGVLAAVAGGRAARAWEFPVAAFYAVACSPWNVIPVLLMGIASAAPAFRGGVGMRPFLGMLASGLALVLFVLGAMELQMWLYPRTAMPFAAMAESWQQTLALAADHTAAMDWTATARHSFLGNIVEDVTSPFTTVMVSAWLLLLFLAVLGLPAAFTRSAIPLLAAFAVLVWSVWFDNGRGAGVRSLTQPVVWTPSVIFLVGMGLEPYVHRWPRLRWPFTLLLAAFLALQILHPRVVIDSLAAPL